MVLAANLTPYDFKMAKTLPATDESTLNKFAGIIFVIPLLNF